MEDSIYESLTHNIRRLPKKKAVFMCGAAGSGKTTTHSKFLTTKNLVYLNPDDIWKVTGNVHTKQILDSMLDRVVKDGYSFLYDGTCKNMSSILDRMTDLKHKGYTIHLNIVYAPLHTALRRIQDRTHQPLDPKVAKGIYKEVTRTVESVMKSDIPDEVYLYDNTTTAKLILHRTSKRIYCDLPNSKFYFDISPYC